MKIDDVRRAKGLTIRATIPATSGNLGPGFDALGLAVELRNEVVIRLTGYGAGMTRIHIEGESAAEMSDGGRNRLVRVFREVLDEAGGEGFDVEVEQLNRIPLCRGLGSSAAAAAGGALAGAALLHYLRHHELGPVDAGDVGRALHAAMPYEGHPDNLVPAMVGGVCLCWTDDRDRVRYLRMEPPSGLTAVLAVPTVEVPTAEARQVLPAAVPMRDAVFSLRRAVLLVSALQLGRWDLLAEGCRDRLQQPRRIGLLPAMGEAIEAAFDAGALSAWVSGSGSSVLALCPTEDAELERAVGEAMAGAFGPVGGAEVRVTALASDGARVTIERGEG